MGQPLLLLCLMAVLMFFALQLLRRSQASPTLLPRQLSTECGANYFQMTWDVMVLLQKTAVRIVANGTWLL